MAPSSKRTNPKPTKSSKSLEARWARILKERRFNLWLTNIANGNPQTAKDMRRKFHVIYEVEGKSPQDLASLNHEEAQAWLITFVQTMATKGLKGHKRLNTKTGKMEHERKPLRHNTMIGYVNAVRTWLQTIDPLMKLYLGKIRVPDTEGLYDSESPPEREYVRNLIAEADKRERVAIAIVAFAGGRIEPLGDATGTDGLEIRDFPELQVANGKVTFTKIPTRIIIRRSLTKRTHREGDRHKYGYMTFMNDEGCEYIQDYLEWRMKNGENLTLESPIIPAEKGTAQGKVQKKIGSHITTGHASDLIKDVVLRANYTDRAYLLRRYFASQLQDAEEELLSIKDYRIFWMGHGGSIEEEYTQNKGQLPHGRIEKQREAYERSSDRHLTTKEPKLVPADKIKAEAIRVFLQGARLPEEKINQVAEKYGGLENVPPDKIPEIVEEYQRKGQRGTYAAGKQIIVPPSDARKYLDEGYRYVATLPTNEIVLQA
jgi:hypothetical protein